MQILKLKSKNKGTSVLIGIGIMAVVLIVVTVIGLYIVTDVENAMTSAGFNSSSTWWTPYQNFVNGIKPAFTLLGVAVLVGVVSVIIYYLLGSLPSR